jgi:hypothetical protein
MSWGWSNSWALSAQYNIAQLCTTATEEAVEQRVNIVVASNVTSRGYVLMSTVKENWAGEQRRHNRSTHYPVWAFVVIRFQQSGTSWQNFGYTKFRENLFPQSSLCLQRRARARTHADMATLKSALVQHSTARVNKRHMRWNKRETHSSGTVLKVAILQVTAHRDKLRIKQPTGCIKYPKFILS